MSARDFQGCHDVMYMTHHLKKKKQSKDSPADVPDVYEKRQNTVEATYICQHHVLLCVYINLIYRMMQQSVLRCQQCKY